MTISEARASFREAVDRVLAGDEITITRHGEVVAVIVRPDALRARRAEQAFREASRLEELLATAAQAPLARASGTTSQRVEELVADVRADRDRR